MIHGNQTKHEELNSFFHSLFSDDALYRQALFRELNIRECVVSVERVFVGNQAQKPHQPLVPTDKPIRSQVSWLPAASVTRESSASALSALTTYREQNDVVTRVDRKNVILQRTKSIVAEKPCRSLDSQPKPTLNDFHYELTEKCKRPNRGLKPCSVRPLSNIKASEQLTDAQKIRIEFEKKIKAKRSIPKPPPPPPINQQKLSWTQLKSLTPKKYPVVECNFISGQSKMPSMTAAKCLALNLMYL